MGMSSLYLVTSYCLDIFTSSESISSLAPLLLLPPSPCPANVPTTHQPLERPADRVLRPRCLARFTAARARRRTGHGLRVRRPTNGMHLTGQAASECGEPRVLHTLQET